MTSIDFITTTTYVGSRKGLTGTYVHETDSYDSISRFLVLAESADSAALRTANTVAAWDRTWTVGNAVDGRVEVHSPNGLEAVITAEALGQHLTSAIATAIERETARDDSRREALGDVPAKPIPTGTYNTISGVTSSPLYGPRATWARQIKSWYPSVNGVAIKGRTVKAVHAGGKPFTLGFVTEH